MGSITIHVFARPVSFLYLKQISFVVMMDAMPFPRKAGYEAICRNTDLGVQNPPLGLQAAFDTTRCLFNIFGDFLLLQLPFHKLLDL